MSALPAKPNFSNRPWFNCGSCSIDSVSRSHGEVVEVHVAVGLRPQPDAARDRLRQDMLEVQLAVETGRDLGPRELDLEIMTLVARRRRVANPFHRGSLAFLEFPQHQIV